MVKITKLRKILFVNCFLAQILYGSGPTLGMDADTDPFVFQGEILKVAALTRETKLAAAEGSRLDSVIVVGNTGSGKSTLITYLAGRPLVAKDGGAAGNTLDTDSPLPGFKIGHGAAVGTRIPSSWRDEASGVTYWDCPGFEDPGGKEREVINAFSVHELFSPPSRIKLVLVADEGSIRTDRGRNFLGLLKRVTSIFSNQEDLKRSLSLVVTQQERINTRTYWGTLLSEPREANPDLGDNNVKSVLEFLAANATTHVAVLPYAKTLGAYDMVHRSGIQAVIAAAKYVDDPVVDVRVGLGAKLLMGELEESANGWISGYVKERISSAINQACEASITGHEKTGRALKADFAEMVSKLKEVRYESQQSFVADLTAILRSRRIDSLIGLIQDRISCLDFFKVINGSVTYRADQWTLALANITKRVEDLSNGEITKVQDGPLGRTLSALPDKIVREWWVKRGGLRGGSSRHQGWKHCHLRAVTEKLTIKFPTGLYSSWPLEGYEFIDSDFVESTRTQAEEYGSEFEK